MDFQITALPASQFAGLFGLDEAALRARGVQRLTADRSPGFPCRVTLRDAAVGEPVLLLNFEHLPVATPYRARYAIYVREGATDVSPAVNEVPPALASRLLSLRAFDALGMLQAADVAQGAELPGAICRLLALPQVSYLHLHNAAAGCYAARAERSSTGPA